jgi:hypothetical protein
MLPAAAAPASRSSYSHCYDGPTRRAGGLAVPEGALDMSS